MRNPAVARQAWNVACEHDPEACAGLADLESLGLGGPRDPDAARRHYTAACTVHNATACRNLAATDPEVWLQAPNNAMLEQQTMHSPQIELTGSAPDRDFRIEAVACFGNTSFEPVRAAITTSSDFPAFDAVVLDTMTKWRARPLRPFPDGVAACVPGKFEVKVRREPGTPL